jgi:hypothetical protein
MKLDAKPVTQGERQANSYRAPQRGERVQSSAQKSTPQGGGSAMADAFARLQGKR